MDGGATKKGHVPSVVARGVTLLACAALMTIGCSRGETGLMLGYGDFVCLDGTAYEAIQPHAGGDTAGRVDPSSAYARTEVQMQGSDAPRPGGASGTGTPASWSRARRCTVSRDTTPDPAWPHASTGAGTSTTQRSPASPGRSGAPAARRTAALFTRVRGRFIPRTSSVGGSEKFVRIQRSTRLNSTPGISSRKVSSGNSSS